MSLFVTPCCGSSRWEMVGKSDKEIHCDRCGVDMQKTELVPKGEALDIVYGDKWIQIEGIKYSHDIFRGWGTKGAPVGTIFQIIERADGVISTEEVWVLAGAGDG